MIVKNVFHFINLGGKQIQVETATNKQVQNVYKVYVLCRSQMKDKDPQTARKKRQTSATISMQCFGCKEI